EKDRMIQPDVERAMARKINASSFDKQTIADTKRFVNLSSLPPDQEIEIEWNAFLASLARPDAQTRLQALLDRGLHKPGDVERRLGYHVGRLGVSNLARRRSWINAVTPGEASTRRHWLAPHRTSQHAPPQLRRVDEREQRRRSREEGNGTRPGRRALDCRSRWRWRLKMRAGRCRACG